MKFAFMKILSCAVIVRVVEAAPGDMNAFKDRQRCGVLTPNLMFFKKNRLQFLQGVGCERINEVCIRNNLANYIKIYFTLISMISGKKMTIFMSIL